MIKEQIQQTINALQQEKLAALRNAEASIVNEKIAPYNAEADALKDKAIEQLTEQYNAAVVELKNNYAANRDAIIVANNKKKEDNKTAVIAAETASIRVKYDNAIAELEAYISKLGE